MASPQEKLATSLQKLKELQDENGIAAIRSKDLSQTHRNRLLKNGFIRRVMKGWYIPADPGEKPGSSTLWYTSFWGFCSKYLNHRFGNQWCISPEQSLSYQVGNRKVPRQLIVRSPKARNKPTKLPHGTSLLEIKAELPSGNDIETKDDLNLYSVSSGLIACTPRYFANEPVDARAALETIRDSSELLRPLLEGGHSTIAGRMAGAYRNMGRDRISDEIIKTMESAGYQIRESDPFTRKPDSITIDKKNSPYVNRIYLIWEEMRKEIEEIFPDPPGIPKDAGKYLKQVEDIFITDAYHSLSIEGYRVTAELIERVRAGDWNPDHIARDREQKNAMAARGYWQAFQVVKSSVKKVLDGKNPGVVADVEHGNWYRELFAPSVTAGMIKASDLAGYRSDQVWIQNSMHVPPGSAAVRDMMPAFFDLLKQEKSAAVRVVLGHFIFVYIHPYMDGNGRMARFLMNVMLASGGYPWTVLPFDERDEYMQSLEEASTSNKIERFTRFIAHHVEEGMKGSPAAKVHLE
ncbi:MAG: cell filamentation protein Fic [Balneolaceae bacterium]|nr:MAG: cell filamentation protein Fic [Balneolaceae bacterium]